MKIKEIRAAQIALKPPQKTTPRPAQRPDHTLHRPLDRYDRFRADRSGTPPWHRIACVVTAEDGTWGLGLTVHSPPVLPIINDHFASCSPAKTAWPRKSCGTSWCAPPRPTAAKGWPATPSAPWIPRCGTSRASCCKDLCTSYSAARKRTKFSAMLLGLNRSGTWS